MELEEVRAAAERLLWKDRMHEDYWSQDDHDECTLVAFVREELARRDKEAAERAMPIDEEWLRSLGQVIRDDRYAIAVRTESMTVVHAKNATKHATAIRFEDAIENVCAVEAKTRGEVIDLRNGLKGNSTQCTC